MRALVDSAGDASRSTWIERRVEGAAGQRRFKASEKYQRITDDRVRASVIAAMGEFGARCPERPHDAGPWPHVLDVAVRIAGTGSLGRLRWAILAQGKSDKPGKERILELKEALPSSLSPDAPCEAAAERVIASQRRLQGAPPAFLGVATVDRRAFTVRELQPTEAKLDAASLKGGDLDALAAACGTVLGRLHRRAGVDLSARLEAHERSIARRLAACALRYADRVTEDHARLRASRDRVEHALGLANGGAT